MSEDERLFAEVRQLLRQIIAKEGEHAFDACDLYVKVNGRLPANPNVVT